MVTGGARRFPGRFRYRMEGITRPAQKTGLPQYPAAGRFVGHVTLARSGFQAVVIENRDIPTAIAEHLAILQRTRGLGDADAAHAQHEGQKRVRVEAGDLSIDSGLQTQGASSWARV